MDKKKQYINEVQISIDFLQEKFENIEEYPDMSLFFQNPEIFDGWATLIRAIDKIDSFYISEREQTTEEHI